MGWGDELIAAGQAQRLHEETGRAVAIVGPRGEIRWHEAWAGLPFIVDPRGHLPKDRVYLRNHSGQRPYFTPPLTPEGGFHWSGWRVSEHRPVMALNREERALGEFWQGRLAEYTVIEPHATGGNQHLRSNRHWGAERFQALVALRGDMAFVQVGPPEAATLEGVQRVITRNFREAAGVLSGATAYIGCQGGLHHAAAALRVPTVAIFGGCEPPELMGYPDNVNLVSRQEGTPCGRILPCDHCARAMAEITPDAVSAALTVLLHKRELGAA